MSSAANMDTYLNNHYEGMTPERLIHMLYKGALRNLNLAREGINESNPKKRGENLSKAIAIVSELYSSLNPEMTDESTQFLRGLYSNMLAELPKISLNNDLKTLDLVYAYLEELSRIWENEVMHKHQGKQSVKLKPVKNQNSNEKIADTIEIKYKNKNDTIYNGYSRIGQKLKAQSIFA